MQRGVTMISDEKRLTTDLCLAFQQGFLAGRAELPSNNPFRNKRPHKAQMWDSGYKHGADLRSLQAEVDQYRAEAESWKAKFKAARLETKSVRRRRVSDVQHAPADKAEFRRTIRAKGHHLEPSPSMVETGEISRTTGELLDAGLDALKRALDGDR